MLLRVAFRLDGFECDERVNRQSTQAFPMPSHVSHNCIHSLCTAGMLRGSDYSSTAQVCSIVTIGSILVKNLSSDALSRRDICQ